MSKSLDDSEAERHRAKMAKRKAVQDAEVAGKTIEKGLLIVHTGTGKGKSTAAIGMVLRCVGHGMRVGIVQFVKGAWETGERRVTLHAPSPSPAKRRFSSIASLCGCPTCCLRMRTSTPKSRGLKLR